MTMHGLSGKLVGFGAELSQEDKVLAYAVATGCPGMLPGNCFDEHMLGVKAQCMAHLPPPAGASQYWWNSFCNKLSSCGLPPACPGLEDAALAKLPQCLSPDLADLVAYAAKYPLSPDASPNGPDRTKNAFTVAAHFAPRAFAVLANLPPCGVEAPLPAPPAPPAYTAPSPAPSVGPPPPDYSAPIVADQTPTAIPTDMPAPPPAYTPSTQASSTGSSKWLLYGLAGAAVLGAGYFMMRKR